MDAYDRHELVFLTSVHGLPVLGARDLQGGLSPGGGQIEPPDGYRLRGIELQNPTPGASTAMRINRLDGRVDHSAIYRPDPLSINELSLSALGGTLDLNTDFIPPVPMRTSGGVNLFDALAIERWRHKAVLGRDIHVEIVSKGFLFPTGHPASLVKVTERRFVPVDGQPVAMLVMRQFLRFRRPVKEFPALGQPNRGRRLPLSQLTLLARQTPDLVDANLVDSETPPGPTGVQVSPKNGRIHFEGEKGLCFWPHVREGKGGEYWFEMRADKESAPIRLPLIFVDNKAANDPGTMKRIADYYNVEVASDKATTFDRSAPTRRMMRGDQPVIMAPETTPGDTTFDTNWWILGAEGLESEGSTYRDIIVNADFKRTSFMLGQDQPPFYPFVETARCRFTQIERFAGAKQGWRDVRYEIGYVREGFPKEPNLAVAPEADPSEIFLKFVKQIDGEGPLQVGMALDDRGDLSGGVAMPNMQFIGMSRKLGPVGGGKKASFVVAAAAEETAAGPAPSTNLDGLKEELRRPDFSNILGDGKLLGIVKLGDVIQTATSLLDDHPKLKETVEYGAAQIKEGAESAREFVTANVLRPAARLVTDVKKEWATFASRTVEVGGETFGLEKAFPEIGQDIVRLEGAITHALSPARSEAEFLASLSVVYESGKRLVRTIDRIRKDPMAAMSSEQLGMIRNIRTQIALIRSLADRAGEGFAAADPAALIKAALLAPLDGRSLRRFVFELPVPPVVAISVSPSGPASPDPELVALAEAVDGALLAALGELKDTLWTPAAAEAFPQRLRQAIDAATKAAGTEGLRARLRNVGARLGESTLDDLSSPAVRAVATAISARTIFDVPARLEAAATNLKDAAGKGGIAELLKQLKQDFPPFFAVLDAWVRENALRQVAPRFQDACPAIHAAVGKMLALSLPAAQSLTDMANCLEGLVSSAPTDQCSAFDAAGQFAAAMVRTLTHAHAFVEAAGADPKVLPDKATIGDMTKAMNALAAVAGKAARDMKAVAGIAGSLRFEGAPAPTSCALPAGFNAVHDARLLARRTAELLESLKEATRHLGDMASVTRSILAQVSGAAAKAAGAPIRGAAVRLVDSIAAMGIGLTRSIQLLMAGLQKKTGALPNGRPSDDIALLAAALRKAADAFPAQPNARRELQAIAGEVESIAKEGSPLFAALAAVNAVDAELQKLRNLAPDASVEQIMASADSIGRQIVALPAQVGESLQTLKNSLHAVALDRLLGMARALTIDALPGIDMRAPLAFLASPAGAILDLLVDGKKGILTLLKDRIDDLSAGIDRLMTSSPLAGKMLESAARQLQTRKLLVVAPPGHEADDLFAIELKHLSKARALLKENPPQFIEAWHSIDHIGRINGPGTDRSDIALVTLFNRFVRIDENLLRHVVLDVLDLRKLRDELERLIRELVPTRIRLAYDLDTPMKPFRDILIPAAGQKLTITMRSEIDLLAAAKDPKAPKFSVRGDVGRFEVRLLGNQLHAVSLIFRGFTFTAGSGQSPDFKVNFERVAVGDKAKFLEQLEEYMSPKGGGLFVKPLENTPGIEAGYGINLGSFGVGYLSFSNVTLNAGAELPFSNGKAALFKVSVGRPDAPFLISSTIFGGGGYLALVANPKGFVGLEGSFDFGGVFAFGFGPLTGTGQITVGVTFSARRNEQSVGGVFMVRGQANIACFSIAASLVVRLHYDGSTMRGAATFTYSFSIGIGDIEFSVSVQNNQGAKLGTGESPGQSASAGNGRTGHLLQGPGRPWPLMYAFASRTMSDAPLGSAAPRRPVEPKAYLRVDVVSRRRQWKKFHTDYFARLPEGADA